MAIRSREKTGLGWMPALDPIQLIKGKVPETLISLIYNTIQNLIDRYNGQISFGDGGDATWAGNLDAQYLNVISSPTPDLAFSVPHGLGRLPIGYDVVRRDSAGVVYDSGPGDWGLDIVYLKCNVASMSFVLRLY